MQREGLGYCLATGKSCLSNVNLVKHLQNEVWMGGARMIRSILAVLALGALFTAQSFALGPQGGDLYVTVFAAGRIDVFRNASTPANAVGIAFQITNLNSPSAIAFDGSGSLFEAEQATGNILKFTAPNLGTIFASGLSSPSALAFDLAGNLYVADKANGTVYVFAPDGTRTTFANALKTPVALAFDRTGNLFVGEQASGTITKITPDGTKTIFTGGFINPAGLAFDTAGNLFVADAGSGTVYKVAPDTTKTFIVYSLNTPRGIAFDSAGNFFVAEYAGKHIRRYDPNGVLLSTIDYADLGPYALAIEPSPRQLTNISTRGLVRTGDNILIAGFILGGSNLSGTDRVLIRALGPTLGQFGLSGVLADPTLEVRDANGVLLAFNDNWQDSQAAEIQATGYAPPNPLESAVIVRRPAGSTTAIVRGKNGGTGLALVDVYQLQ